MASRYNITAASISLFGSSFGATLALLISSMYACTTVAISSPMSDLPRHILQTSENPKYLHWFTTRFSPEDFERFSLPRLSKCRAKNIFIFHGKEDHICRPSDTTELAHLMINAGKHVKANFPENFGHAPKDSSELISYLLWVRRALI